MIFIDHGLLNEFFAHFQILKFEKNPHFVINWQGIMKTKLYMSLLKRFFSLKRKSNRVNWLVVVHLKTQRKFVIWGRPRLPLGSKDEL
jgi:hypothetical protein